MEAFDQPWKAAAEGKVGAYWGVYDADRQQKFAFSAPIVQGAALAGARGGLGAHGGVPAVAVLFPQPHAAQPRPQLPRGRRLRNGDAVRLDLYDFSQQYLTVTACSSVRVLIVGMLGVIAVLLAEAHEWAEAHWVTKHQRLFQPRAGGGRGRCRRYRSTCRPTTSRRRCSCETLDALARLDYPDFEVLVIDNNTATRPCGGRSRRTAPGSARASAFSTSRRSRVQGRRAQLRAARTRRPTPTSSPSSTRTTSCARTGCATSCRRLRIRAQASCRRRRTTATRTRARSRRCATRSTAASSTSAWSRATSATRSSSTAR